MKVADIDPGALEQFAVDAGIRGSQVEVHVTPHRWELRAEGIEKPLAIEPQQPQRRQGTTVTTTDHERGDSETMELEPNGYIVVCGERREVSHEQHYPKTGTSIVTIKAAGR